jgi:DNA-binding response OmpR family regulator
MDQSSNRRYDFSGISMLLVDQNRFIRTIVANICRSFGVERVYESDDAPDAFTLMKQTPIDIVVTEWMLEPLDGRDFARLVRTARDSPNPMVPIIMLTGHTQAQYVIEARDAGVSEFLCKPVSSRNLLNRMIHVIERPRSFVKSPGYVGPDRRRRDVESYTGPERRKEPTPRKPKILEGKISTSMEWDLSPKVPTGGGNTQSDIDALFA